MLKTNQKEVPVTSIPILINHLIEQIKEDMKSPFDLLTISEAADLLKCGERTIKTYLYETYELRYLKVGRQVRIRESDLLDFINRRVKSNVFDQEVTRCR